jgi:hypothetical protein
MMLTAAWLVSCAGHHPAAPTTPLPLSELHVLSMPVALNFDKVPGADGFVVKVYGVSLKQPKTVPIRQGTLEVLMYDGALTGSLTDLTPVHVWRFTASELKPFEITTSIGTGYNLALKWEQDHPKEKRVTVIARYQAEDGTFLYSARTSLAVVDVDR